MRQEVTHVPRVQLSGVCTCLTINTGHLKEPSAWVKRLGTDNGAAAVRTPAASGSGSNFHSPATSGSFRALRRQVSCAAAAAEKETQKMQQLAWSQDQSWDSLPPGSRITRRPCQHLRGSGRCITPGVGRARHSEQDRNRSLGKPRVSSWSWCSFCPRAGSSHPSFSRDSGQR